MSDNVSPAKAQKKISKQIAKLDRASTPLLNRLVSKTKDKQSKYSRYSTDMESVVDAYHALPSVYKFFWMIYRLSPVRTIVIIAVFMVQGLLPALRLRTGGDFIIQVPLLSMHRYTPVMDRVGGLTFSCKMGYRVGR
jgi:hypothetical protein